MVGISPCLSDATPRIHDLIGHYHAFPLFDLTINLLFFFVDSRMGQKIVVDQSSVI